MDKIYREPSLNCYLGANRYYILCPTLPSTALIMSLNTIRNLSSSARRQILRLIGKVTLEDVQSMNGARGSNFAASVKDAAADVESRVCVWPSLSGLASLTLRSTPPSLHTRFSKYKFSIH